MHIWLILFVAAAGVALGGTFDAYKNIVVCAIMVVAWVAVLIVLNIPGATLTLPVWAGIVVGLTTTAFVKAGISCCSPSFLAPSSVMLERSPTCLGISGRRRITQLLDVDVKNPLFCITLSILVAGVFVLFSLKVTGMMSMKATTPVPAECSAFAQRMNAVGDRLRVGDLS